MLIVLILVILELTLREEVKATAICKEHNVLILVILELTLRVADEQNPGSFKEGVLILVILELTLREDTNFSNWGLARWS